MIKDLGVKGGNSKYCESWGLKQSGLISRRLESRGQKRSQPKLSHFPYGRVEPRGHDCPHTDDVAGLDDNAEWEKAYET